MLDLPLVEYRKQKRPAQKVDGINALIAAAESDEERYLYVLLAGDRHADQRGIGSRIKTLHQRRSNHRGRATSRKGPSPRHRQAEDARIVSADRSACRCRYLPSRFLRGKSGLILRTENDTPYLYGNLADDWLDPRLAKLGLYEAGMG